MSWQGVAGSCAVKVSASDKFAVRLGYVDVRHSIECRWSPANDNRAQAEKFDQFYTQPHVAAYLLGVLKQHCDLTGCRMLEPSAGSGAFFRLLPAGRIGFDLYPKCAGVVRADFLEQKRQKWFAAGDRVVAIGNPPFGHNAGLAIRFFNHAAEWCETLAFIVPASFQKATVENKLDRRFQLIHQEALEHDSFLFGGKPYSVPTVFQIWRRQDEPRQLRQIEKTHPHFEFTSREDATFAIRRNGANAGRVEEIADQKDDSCHFIKGPVRGVMEQLQFSRFTGLVTGAKSLSQGEIVLLYQEWLVQHCRSARTACRGVAHGKKAERRRRKLDGRPCRAFRRVMRLYLR